jgi:hypothetical protein
VPPPFALYLYPVLCKMCCIVHLDAIYNLYHQPQDPQNPQRKAHSCRPYQPDKVATPCRRRGCLVATPSRSKCNTPVRPGVLHSQRVQSAGTLRLARRVEQAVERVDALLRCDSAQYARVNVAVQSDQNQDQDRESG